jgi:hypothetical protein
VVPFASQDSFIRSEPDYPVKVDAVFTHGSDFIRLDPSGKHSRLDVTSVLKDKSGAVISFHYSGLLTMSSGVRAVLGGNPDAKTTAFGDACEFKMSPVYSLCKANNYMQSLTSFLKRVMRS